MSFENAIFSFALRLRSVLGFCCIDWITPSHLNENADSLSETHIPFKGKYMHFKIP